MSNCLNCNSLITSKYAKKFCCKSCSAQYNNSRRDQASRDKQRNSIRNRYNNNNSNLFVCQQCSIEFRAGTGAKQYKFCSRGCLLLNKASQQRQRFIDGKIVTSDSLRKHLTEDRGYSCEECGISEWNNSKLTLQVDHINGDPGNNFPDNLRLLCPNCHSQTPTYKGGNRFDLKMDDRSVMHRRIYRKRMRAG